MPSPLKILFFIETGGPGGAERVVLDLLDLFREIGDEVGLCTLRTGWLTENALAHGHSYVQLKSERGLDLTLPGRLSRIIKSSGYQVLHSHLLDSNFYGSLAAKLSGARHIGTEHGDIHHTDRKKFIRLKLKVATLGSSTITSVSEYSAKKLCELGVKPSKIHLVPNAIPDPPVIDKARRERTRAMLGAESPECWVWMHVGNLRPVKDQGTIIRGFSQSFKECNANQLLVILGDGEERDALENLSLQLGVKERVRFLGHRDQVNNFLEAGDGFLMSSLSESMPMALLEAISYRLAPLCSNVGGIPEVLNIEKLFTPGDSEYLAKLISETIREPQVARLGALRLETELRLSRSRKVIRNRYRELYLNSENISGTYS